MRVGRAGCAAPGHRQREGTVNISAGNPGSSYIRPRAKVDFATGAPAPGIRAELSFDDLGEQAPVSAPEHMLEGWRGVREGDLSFEAAVGRYVTISAALLGILADMRRAVALIQTEGIDFKDEPGRWAGTGFLVGRNLLLTNQHVLNSIASAERATAAFDYEVSREALIGGDVSIASSRRVFRLNPGRLFISSPARGGLDYAFVWIEEAAAASFGFIPMERSSFMMKKGEQAFVIHHPDERPKEASVDDTDVVHVDSRVVLYASDTDYGSSGAPVFNRQGNLVALHHASRKQAVELPDGHSAAVINEGIKIAAIALDLEAKSQRGGAEAAMAREVLSAIKGSDTLTGFFGGLGRSTAGENDLERVVNTYKGDEADFDLAFWNIEHLATRHDDLAKLEGAATVIADMKLDAWCLSEVSADSVAKLCATIEQRFGEVYRFAASDPDAGSAQATAVIWRDETVMGTVVPWPPEIEAMLRLRSTDPAAAEFEAVHGKIFDRYPALFRLETRAKYAGKPFVLHTVPLHLKAMPDGSLRRRMASGILARAVAILDGKGFENIVLGGDMNATLASGDLDRLKDAGLVALGARDESEGAITYIKGRYKSLIDNIFLSPNLATDVGYDDFMVVARDREIPAFVRTISDHRPVMVRLALGVRIESSGEAVPIERAFNVDTLLDGIVGRDVVGRPPAKPPAPSAMDTVPAEPGAITFEELKRRMADPAIPDAELRPYLEPARRERGPLRPEVRPNPERVILPPAAEAELESAMDWGNGWSRWRRLRRFEIGLVTQPTTPVLLSEGDSWFQFPLLLDDVIDHLSNRYLVRSLDAAGDTLDNMIIRNPEYLVELEALQEQLAPSGRQVDGFLLSAAGNDVIGEDTSGRPALLGLLKDLKAGKSASWHVDSRALKKTLDFIEAAYRKAIGMVRARPALRTLPIIIHGYDYAIPGGFAGDTRQPGYAAQDQWLGGPMREKGILEPRLQRDIIKVLIDALYQRLEAIAGQSVSTGVHVVDCRGLVGAVIRWNDEIHPTSDGYRTVAEQFHGTIEAAIRGRAP
jgi:endonuclease/exonuclease/phosphatase family metal-dependent hydrolase